MSRIAADGSIRPIKKRLAFTLVVFSALARAGVALGENGNVIPGPKGRTSSKHEKRSPGGCGHARASLAI